MDCHQATAVKTSKNDAIRISTWYVRTLFMAGQLENLKQEMETLDIDILGVCEMRWTGNGRLISDDKGVLNYGGDTHAKGVGIIVKKELAKSIIGCWAISIRVMVVKLKVTPVNINIIDAYATTSNSSETALETLYDQLDEAMPICKASEMKIVMGDFDAKIGEGRQNQIVEPCGYGSRN